VTEPGVPVDEMSSDGLPLNWGPAPEEEPDLEALLSGDAGYVPEALRPLAGVLAALRAVPAPEEHDGETAARAAFLRFLPPVEDDPVPAAGRADDVRALPPPPPPPPPPLTADGRPPRNRHRHRRRSPGRGRRTAIALLGSAAAVVVGFAALAGAFSGHGGQAGQPGRSLGATTTAQPGGGTKSSVLEGQATAEPTARPAPTTPRSGPQATGPAAASGRQELCQKYYMFLAHPGPAEIRAVKQLIALVGLPVNVPVYCAVSVPVGREPQIPGPQIPGPFATAAGGQSGRPGASVQGGTGGQPGLPRAAVPGATGSQPGAPGASRPGDTGSQRGVPGNPGTAGNSAPGGVRGARTAR
jgi:hypothetical protein